VTPTDTTNKQALLLLPLLLVQAMDTRLTEHQRYKVSPVSCAAVLPWALPFFAYLSNAGLEVAAHQLLNVVRIQRAAASAAAAAGLQRLRALPAADMAGSSSSNGARDALQQVLEAATSSARLFTAWLTSEQVHSMPLTEEAMGMDVDTPAAAALRQEAVAEVDVLECFATSLLQLLQLVTTKAALGGGTSSKAPGSSPLGPAAAKAKGGDSSAAASSKLALGTALEQLLPLLCVLAARSSSALSSAEAAAAHDEVVAARQQVQGLAAVVQLIICICQHHLPPSTWAPVVRSQLQLVMLVTHMMVRVAGRMQAAAVVAPTTSAALPMVPGGGATAAAVAAAAAPGVGGGASPELQQAAVVLDASILELANVAAGAADAARELCHQGLVGVLVRHAQILQDPTQGGLLAAAAVAPGSSSADAGAGVGEDMQAAASLALWVPNTLGAYCWPTKAAMAADAAAAATAAAAAKAASPRRRSAAGAGAGGAAAGGGRPQQQLVRSHWNPVHQQWCQWLSLAALLLQQLRGQEAAEEVAMDLFSACQARLQLSLAALQRLQASSRAGGIAAAGVSQEAWLTLLRSGDMGSGWATRRKEGSGHQQQLGLALLVEAERGLQLLCGVAGYAGAWQLVAPGSLAAFRAAMSGVLQFAALPSGR
jgi:hypothetical protein